LPDFLDQKVIPQKKESAEPSTSGVVGLPAAAVQSDDQELVGATGEAEQTGWGDDEDEIELGDEEEKGWGEDAIDLDNL